MPKLRVSAGPSISDLKSVAVNEDDKPFDIRSDHFHGRIAVRVKDFKDENGKVQADSTSKYFERYSDMTWSIQIQGKFLQQQDLDDVVFGNTFDKPIRDMLPYGTAVALKFVNFIDPALEQDIYADKPWAWSPLVSTMNFFKATDDVQSADALPEWDGARPEDDTAALLNQEEDGDGTSLKSNPDARRKWFANVQHRKGRHYKENAIIEAEFCNGFIDFNNLSLRLPVGNLHFGLAKYWDGQPVRYMCQTRSGTPFFVVQFDLVDTEGVDGVQKAHTDFATTTK